ncbi:DUF1552 domain-containing protein [Sorangium sp. So ce119]|uniref:DUF1552 domain-containing protein n=1 Tax=Sorangium sp. So ce119 TaxID=3133279 RepID=UPI003F6480A4
MIGRRMNRRTLLGGLLAGALGSLMAGPTARGDQPGPRKRFVVWFTPNGTIESAFRPTGGERDFTLGPILEPLEPLRDHLLLFGPEGEPDSDFRRERGLSIRISEDGPSGGHGCSKLLTGRLPALVEGNEMASGPSVDQVIAAAVGQDDYLRSLELGVRSGAPSSRDHLLYAGAGQPVPPENNPSAAFDRAFAGLATVDPDAERRKNRRREVLRFAREEAKRLAPRLGGADRQRIDAHEAALADLDARLDGRIACAPPGLLHSSPGDWEEGWDTYDKMPDVGRAQMDILATALGCGITHVGSLQWTAAAANARHPFVDAPEWHHELSHHVVREADRTVDPVVTRKVIDINRWYASQLAYFLGRLKEMPERDGSSVLDHTVVLWCNEMSDGFYHTHQNMPFLLAGGAGGHFRTGRYLKFENRAHNDLLTSLCQAMGLSLDTFGDPAFCDGALPGLA